MKYALIGCGRISSNHIKAAIENNIEIVALCDLAHDNASALAERFNLKNIRFYTDYKKMITTETIDIIAIATPSGNHKTEAIDCINAGINVIIEKPIALSIEDADLIIKSADENNAVVACCHQNRFNRSVQKLKSAVDAGRFGRIYHIAAHVRWNRNESYYEHSPWRGTWAQDGGCLMNQCIHNFDLLRWIMASDIKEVFAYTDNFAHPYIEAEDVGLGVLKFENGGLGLIEGTVNVFPENLEETLYVFGENGTVKLGGASVNRIDEWRFKDERDTLESVKHEFSENPPNVYGFGHTPLYADMINAVKNSTKPYISAEDGKKSLELILAMYESSATKKPIKLPLTDCASSNFFGQFDHNHIKVKG